MTIDIQMPALSPTMESGTLAKWHVKVGDAVTSGDILCEIETDKATMEVETIDDGVVGKLLVADGTEEVPVGAVIAVLLEDGEDASAIDTSDISEASATTTPSPTPSAPVPSAPVEVKVEAVVEQPSQTQTTGRIKASPLAKRIAKDKGLDLSTIQGSGPNGRIIKADVEGTTPAQQPVTAPVQTIAPAEAQGDAPYEEVKLSNMRKTIAKRLTEAKQTVPHFYLTVEVELDKLLSLRKEINSQLEGAKISVNDFIIRASALGLKRVPNANVQYGGNVMRHYSRADISVAVATDGGLITPIIKGADVKGLKEISVEMKELAGKAKEGKLMPEEYQGGTFSISNLGMMGVKEFSAVINPPQGAILAVGAGTPQAVVKDGAIQSATVMSMTLSCDHRAI
ncbi:MAG: pyruvate dehydrogenase complex dihydrolipoamide acetyltransferase, partial [Sphingomonadales bacterium]|nr:pyruvate dehydrogenase complex dihydrolipoamide acetyltransferase [Sphingomonadales bacterium]